MKMPFTRIAETVEAVSEIVDDVRGVAASASDDMRSVAVMAMLAFGAVTLVALLALSLSTAALARVR